MKKCAKLPFSPHYFKMIHPIPIREGRLCSLQRLVLTKMFDIPASLVLAYLLTYARKVVATDFQQLQYIRT